MGFDKYLLVSGKGNGWKNMNSRAKLISGEIDLDTTVGMKGNTFILNVNMNITPKEPPESVHQKIGNIN